jgi:hypothetical protein
MVCLDARRRLKPHSDVTGSHETTERRTDPQVNFNLVQTVKPNTNHASFAALFSIFQWLPHFRVRYGLRVGRGCLLTTPA